MNEIKKLKSVLEPDEVVRLRRMANKQTKETNAFLQRVADDLVTNRERIRELEYDNEGLRRRLHEALHKRLPDYAYPVMDEMERAENKFPSWPTDPLHALGIVHEEIGELSKAVLQAVYEPQKQALDAVRNEAIQAAAMTLRFVKSQDQYVYQESEQHQDNIKNESGGRDYRISWHLCFCGDPEHCTQRIPGYVCKADLSMNGENGE